MIRPYRGVIAAAVFWVALAWSAWLLMMLLHEAGHVAAAWVTGGSVQRVVWEPTAFSRTDVYPNPRPLVVAWAGPVIGSALPLLMMVTGQRHRWRLAAGFFAGFCLIANGTYIGVGSFSPVGDARDLLRYGTPPWLMQLFGLVAAAAGLWLWHRVSAEKHRAAWRQLISESWMTATLMAVLLSLAATATTYLR